MKQGHDKGSAFAICTDSFKKAGKPIYIGKSEAQRLHLFCESFRLEGNRVFGVAIHPKRIFHPEEGMTHVYLREELEKAAPTLVGKPFGIDHQYVLPPPNVITKAWYCERENGVCFEGIVDDEIKDKIRRKAFKGISIELNWLRPGGSVEYVNGVAARDFELTSVHFLTRFPPGDPEAYVRLWEQLGAFLPKGKRRREQLVVAPALPLDQRVEALERQIQEVLNQIQVINGKLEVLTGSAPSLSQVPLVSQSSPEGERDLAGGFSAIEGSKESIVDLRRKLAQMETQLAEMKKQQTETETSWRRKYEGLWEAVKGAVPPPRIWKSWTLGPQRYVQENLRILRETRLQSQS
jgi:hypothetical protein